MRSRTSYRPQPISPGRAVGGFAVAIVATAALLFLPKDKETLAREEAEAAEQSRLAADRSLGDYLARPISATLSSGMGARFNEESECYAAAMKDAQVSRIARETTEVTCMNELTGEPESRYRFTRSNCGADSLGRNFQCAVKPDVLLAPQPAGSKETQRTASISAAKP